MGEVTGRIVGASAGALVYPLGRPDLQVAPVVQPDGVAAYSLPAVPTSIDAIVIFDGSDRAERVPVRLAGGTVNRIPDRFGAAATVAETVRMPLAGTVLAAAVPDGGATPWRPTFSLRATVHAELVPATGGVYAVWPLPAGTYEVSAALAGFEAGRTTVSVSAAMTSAAPVSLLIDVGATAPGCGAVPVTPQCGNGLICEPSDGKCYECTAIDTSRCPGACNLETHLCEAPAPAASTACSPCASAADCATGMICRIAYGAVSGYCTFGGCSSDSDCPAGFDCSDYGVCRAPKGCDAWIQTMGASCYSSSRCDSEYYGGLEDGWCAGAVSETAGYCTAACQTDSDCAVGSVTSLVCRLGPSPYGERMQCLP